MNPRKLTIATDKRRKTAEDETEDDSTIRSLFDFSKNGSINVNAEKIVLFIKRCFDVHNKEQLFKNFKEFISDENNKYEFLSLFYHSFESSDSEVSDNTESENAQLRYFADTRVCYGCGETGHVESKCPKRTQQICILCGYTDHPRFNCPQIVCTKCGLCGHRYRECKENVDRRKRYIICTRCPNKHTIPDCPLTWRRYKFDRLSKNSVRMSCCNCLKNDHFVDDCDLRRSKTSIFTGYYEQMVYHRRWNRDYRDERS
ncbi:hypothetical protein VCUG_01632 [Vavraia culicis subsp. floridensis]|uniref:CCHC-type domain-containing protein n=1 Tax=Vavraia culicis (isolate floridensis) TaxID=948595 RepID=L2GU97_VAVCU|nr:uncharacterized protein VCUG_01632 [Vavraia culicis subsp. floridensis]ELA46858.1 hypothetical protein VCUG_01632 [Vavraia culicis subsp. floridensis]